MKYVTIALLSAAVGLMTVDSVVAQGRSNELVQVFSTVMVDDDGGSAGVLQSETRSDGGVRGRTGESRTGDQIDSEDRQRTRTGDQVETRDRQRGRTGDIGRADRRTTTRGGEDVVVTRDRDGQRNRNERVSRSGRSDGSIFGGTKAGKRGKNGQGPKFCQNGNGHPVHGRAWCREKGFGTGGGIFGSERRSRVGDIIFPAPRRRTNDRIVQGGVLGDVLGDVVLGRLNRYSRENHGSSVSGRWVGDDELQLFAGGTRVARLVDVDGDSRADYLFLRDE